MIRFATKEDSLALLKIYSQYIDTAITFEYILPTEQEFSQRIETIIAAYPYLVCEQNGQIVGYAYAHRFKERAAYQWNAELSVYIDQECTLKGLGRRFYQIMIDMLKLQGVKTVYGIVTVPNERSEKLHHSFGFTRLGTYHNTGYKCGKWRDVAIFEKEIAAYNTEPAPFIPIRQVAAKKLLSILLESSNKVIQHKM